MNTKWFAVLALLLTISACTKHAKIGTPDHPAPPNVLVLKFASKIKFVIDLEVDGQKVPVKYGGSNKELWVHGLEPGAHHFNIHSVSYVFGPEFEQFRVNDDTGAFYFIQNRRYRSAIPKEKERVSIRAYRRQLKRGRSSGVIEKNPKIWAEFK